MYFFGFDIVLLVVSPDVYRCCILGFLCCALVVKSLCTLRLGLLSASILFAATTIFTCLSLSLFSDRVVSGCSGDSSGEKSSYHLPTDLEEVLLRIMLLVDDVACSLLSFLLEEAENDTRLLLGLLTGEVDRLEL